MVLHAVSPHLDPLPQGEETAGIAQRRAESSGLYSTARRVHPLPALPFPSPLTPLPSDGRGEPKGEGRGEGKVTTALRSRNDLSYGRCLQGYLALSHSRFQALRLCRRALTGVPHGRGV